MILTVQTMFFFIFYQQMSTSLNLFALRNVDWSFSVFGAHLWTWSPAQFQAFSGSDADFDRLRAWKSAQY